jgi:hypothetical protein
LFRKIRAPRLVQVEIAIVAWWYLTGNLHIVAIEMREIFMRLGNPHQHTILELDRHRLAIPLLGHGAFLGTIVVVSY